MLTSLSNIDEFINNVLSGDIQRFDGDHRLARIMAAAMRECAQTGFRNAAMARIAKSARVSTASLYQEFGTREKLLADAVVFAGPLVAAEFMTPVVATEPRERLIQLLLRHCRVYEHPHAQWLFRAHVSGDLPKEAKVLSYGRRSRTNVENFWRLELEMLEKSGVIAVPDMDEAINFLLGSVQRRTLIALLLFGADDVAEPSLQDAATSAVDWFLHQFSAATQDQAVHA